MNLTSGACMLALRMASNPDTSHTLLETSNMDDYWTQLEVFSYAKMFGAGAEGDAPPALPRNLGGASVPHEKATGHTLLSSQGVVCVPDDPNRGQCLNDAAQVPCPALAQPNIPLLEVQMTQGAVRTSSAPSASSRPLHLFVMATAFTGSTALLDLVLTSPQSTGLCSPAGQLCEGFYLAPGFDWNQRMNPKHIPDWGLAFSVWDGVWDPYKAVRVEKSPEWAIPGRFETLLDFLKRSGRDVGFLFMSRSRCYGFRPLEDVDKTLLGCHDQVSILASALEKTKVSGFPYHVVHYEELVSDPYGTAQAVVDAFPSLGSLDPASVGVPAEFRHDSHHPATGVARYVMEKQSLTNAYGTISAQQASDAACLGYLF